MKLHTPSDLEGLSNQARRCNEQICTKRGLAFLTSAKKRLSDEVCEANNRIIGALPEKMEVSRSLAEQMIADTASHFIAVQKINDAHAADAFHILSAMTKAAFIPLHPAAAIDSVRSATKFAQRLKGHEEELRAAQEKRDRILGPVLAIYQLVESKPGHFELRRGRWFSDYSVAQISSSYSAGPVEDYNPKIHAGVQTKLLEPVVERLLNNPDGGDKGAGRQKS